MSLEYEMAGEMFISPITGENLILDNNKFVDSLQNSFPIIDGVPRFITANPNAVSSFGDEWNYFNFTRHKDNWLKHVCKNTFGTSEPKDIFEKKIVIDAGAGSGAQSLWIAQSNASLVLSVELSHSIDGVMRENLANLKNCQRIQGSIDNMPLRDEIADMVYCVNVVQHTKDVRTTITELFRLVKPGGELVFTCYSESGWGTGYKHKIRKFVHNNTRKALSATNFNFILRYAKLMSVLRFIPILGWVLEGCLFMARGDVAGQTMKKKYDAGVLNTFDMFGSHEFQHVLSAKAIEEIIQSLNPTKVENFEKSFGNPPVVGAAVRVFK